MDCGFPSGLLSTMRTVIWLVVVGVRIALSFILGGVLMFITMAPPVVTTSCNSEAAFGCCQGTESGRESSSSPREIMESE